jgi:hypothetical protein
MRKTGAAYSVIERLTESALSFKNVIVSVILIGHARALGYTIAKEGYSFSFKNHFGLSPVMNLFDRIILSHAAPFFNI